MMKRTLFVLVSTTIMAVLLLDQARAQPQGDYLDDDDDEIMLRELDDDEQMPDREEAPRVSRYARGDSKPDREADRR